MSNPKKPLLDDQQNTLAGLCQADIDAAVDKMHNIVVANLALGMQERPVFERADLTHRMLGASRTSAAGALVYGALYGTYSGLTKDQVVNLVSELCDLLHSIPTTQVIIDDYRDKVILPDLARKAEAKFDAQLDNFTKMNSSSTKH